MYRLMILVSLLLLGCVAHIPIEEQSPDLTYLSNDRLVISVVDKRWRVQEGKPATGIGVVRSMGIPTVAHTYPWYVDNQHKGQPLAQALEDRIVYGLNDEGWNTIAAGFASLPGPDEITEFLSQNRSEKVLILTLKDWWCDINLNRVSGFRFDWDATVEIYGKKGNLITSFSDAGRDIIEEEGSDSWPNMIRRAYRARLIKFLEKPQVIDALIAAQ
ncbi:MAG: hypothetical protein AMJ54_14975 [Deltaproteobacteria bacterium SG8_13]|nr:MAG: hypothetical protein AMJ54_14975 [Deltaproteobacteria bacterium SG8_13]